MTYHVATTLAERLLRREECAYPTCKELGIEPVTWRVVNGNYMGSYSVFHASIPISLPRVRFLEGAAP